MRPFVLFAALILPPAPLAGQEPARLTLQEAVRMALATSPAFAAAIGGRDAASHGVREARSQWLPQVAADGSVFRYAEPMVVAPIHGFTPDRIPEFDRTLVQGSLSAGYTLFDGGARRGLVAQARAVEDLAEARMDATGEGVIVAVVRAYMDVVAAAGQVEAQQLRMRALEAETDRVERFLAEGRAAEVDLYRVRAALAQARADEVTAVQRLALAETELARRTGVGADRVRAAALVPVTAASAGAPDREALRGRARATNPELRAAAQRVATAAAAVRLASATWFPTLRVEGRLLHYGAADAPGSTEWQTGVRAAWPLFTGGRRLAAVDRARAGVAEAEAALREAELAVAYRLDRALAAVVEADGRAEALAAAAAHLAEVARIEGLALEQGAGTQAEYLRAEAELSLARAALIQARSTQVAARVEVAGVVGGLSPETLTTIVRTDP